MVGSDSVLGSYDKGIYLEHPLAELMLPISLAQLHAAQFSVSGLWNDSSAKTVKRSPTEMKLPQSGNDLVKASLLYQEFQAEREEILRHKWFESEKAGHDIGFDKALVDWQIKHRSQWWKEWQQKHVPFNSEI